MSHGSVYALLYDRDCGLCRTIVAAALSLDRDGRLHPLALQDEQAVALLAGMSDEQRMASFHIVEESTAAVASAGAGLALLAVALPATGPLGRMLRRSPRFTDFAYRLIAGNRDRIGPLIPRGVKSRATRRIAEAEARAEHA
ncbi:MAG TPA: DCC1-like thiol-disulfide oxidoreductase family protein [Solirubrobacteraceae bacterium]|jgi:predicted DCC family thiol-disulfide oxidoreductase YuxK|nr:DCC1-like thiol-disulfide oxidoreductase family protein [Solirubrobacteraceae bacterium]